MNELDWLRLHKALMNQAQEAVAMLRGTPSGSSMWPLHTARADLLHSLAKVAAEMAGDKEEEQK